MKKGMKLVSTLLATAAILTAATATVFAKQTDARSEVSVYVDDKAVSFPDQEPVIRSSRTLVPVRFIAEALGYKVDWTPPLESNTKQGIAVIDNGRIKLEIGTNKAVIDGTEVILDVESILIGDRTMVPLRLVSETLGCLVDWYADSKTVRVTSDDEATVWERLKASGEYNCIENYESGYYGSLMPCEVPETGLPAWLIKRDSNMLEYGSDHYDCEIRVHSFDHDTLESIRKLLMIIYPTGYDEVYELMMKSIKGELWECLRDGTPYLASGTFGTHYIDDREVSIYAAYGLPYMTITIEKTGYLNPDTPLALDAEAINDLTTEAKKNYPLAKYGLD